MKAKTILSWVACAFMVVSFLVCVLMGGCPDMIDTAMGTQVPMKCHWAFHAGALVSCLGVVSALLASIAKSTDFRKACVVLTIVNALAVIACSATPIIGICAKAGMPCHTTALFADISCIAAIVVEIIVLVLLGKNPSKQKMAL